MAATSPSTSGSRRESSSAASLWPIPATYSGFDANARKSPTLRWRMSIATSQRSWARPDQESAALAQEEQLPSGPLQVRQGVFDVASVCLRASDRLLGGKVRGG